LSQQYAFVNAVRRPSSSEPYRLRVTVEEE